jgi:hypothetical protein
VGGSSPDITTGGIIVMKRGKKYLDAVKTYDRSNFFDASEAIALVKKNATAKFDETIEVHIRIFQPTTLHWECSLETAEGVNCIN